MTRYDISKVAPQGGYVAKQCPVRAQNDVLVPCVPIPAPPELQRRFDRGNDFEEAVVREILRLHGAAWIAEGDTREARVASTLEGVAKRAPVILGGRLPTDLVGRRVGKPDLLVLGIDGTYRPVDVKHHMTLESAVAGRNGLRALVASLDGLGLEVAEVDEARWTRKREEDALQLAHYQRMLETAGLAASEGRWGGIIGVEGVVVWYDLDAPIWRTPSSSGRQKLRSTMERYDFEFEFRLDVIAVAEMSGTDPSVELLVVPVRIGECWGDRPSARRACARWRAGVVAGLGGAAGRSRA